MNNLKCFITFVSITPIEKTNNRNTMELRQLKYFVEVAMSLSFSEASRKLYITQGTISQQIRQLEDEMGTQLFDRTSQKIVLTEAGLEMLPLALKVIEDADICREKITNLRNAAVGTLNIGATRSFCRLINSAMFSFLREVPGVKLTVSYKTASEQLYMLRRNEIDMAVAFRPDVQYEDIVTYPLFRTHLCAVMRNDHPLSNRTQVTLSELEPTRDGRNPAGGRPVHHDRVRPFPQGPLPEEVRGTVLVNADGRGGDIPIRKKSAETVKMISYFDNKSVT